MYVIFLGGVGNIEQKAMLNVFSEELTTGLKNQWWHICLCKIKTPSLSGTMLRSTCKTQYNTQWGSRSPENGSHSCRRTGSAGGVMPAQVVCCNTASSQSYCKAAGGQGEKWSGGQRPRKTHAGRVTESTQSAPLLRAPRETHLPPTAAPGVTGAPHLPRSQITTEQVAPRR